MYTRHLPLPKTSFFLFGPRATGKTTWLRQELGDAHWCDLVPSETFLRYLHEPATFRREVEALPASSWVVVDEVQKVPALLDEVHGLRRAHAQRRLLETWSQASASTANSGRAIPPRQAART